MPRSLLNRLFRPREVESRVYKCNMRKCLWEIANQSLRVGVIFLGQKSDIVPERKQPFKQLLRFLASPCYEQIICEPKAASEECALAGGQAVTGVRGVIASDKAVRQ